MSKIAEVDAETGTVTKSGTDTTSKEELAEFLRFLRQQAEAGIEGTKGVVSEQAPLVVQEIVMRQVVEGVTLLLIGAIVTAAATTTTHKSWKSHLEHKAASKGNGCGYNCWGCTSAVVIGVVGGVASLVFLGIGTYACLSAWLTPRLVVLEYVRGLL